MLKKVASTKARARGRRFAIVASKYNARYVDSMLRAAKSVLRRADVKELRIVRVPGAYEIPIVAARLARQSSPLGTASPAHVSGFTSQALDAIICLGVILRGETTHAAHIGDAVSRALMDLQLRYEVPLIHEVLLLENHEQARARCLDPHHNRGAEAAHTALAMAKLMSELG